MSNPTTTTMTHSDPAEIDLGLVTIDLRAELSPEELAAFLANARAAGRTPTEHFKAISLGERHPQAA
jgi:hypothetical protein